MVSSLALLVLAVVFLYMVYIVWSYCEDLSSSPDFSVFRFEEDSFSKRLQGPADGGHVTKYAADGTTSHDPSTCSTCRDQRMQDAADLENPGAYHLQRMQP